MAETRTTLFQRLGNVFRRNSNTERRGLVPNWLTTSPFTAVIPRSGLQSGQDALQLSALYACVSRITDTICSMEVGVESVGADGSRTPLPQHRHTELLGRSPNKYMGSYEFWQMSISDALLYGTGHALIMPDKSEMYWLSLIHI